MPIILWEVSSEIIKMLYLQQKLYLTSYKRCQHPIFTAHATPTSVWKYIILYLKSVLWRYYIILYLGWKPQLYLGESKFLNVCRGVRSLMICLVHFINFTLSIVKIQLSKVIAHLPGLFYYDLFWEADRSRIMALNDQEMCIYIAQLHLCNG